MIAVDTRGGAIVLLVFALILLGTWGEHRTSSRLGMCCVVPIAYLLLVVCCSEQDSRNVLV